ncbi:MAG: polysaccharide deacetylase family protein [Patescibacteria group bacterium]|jgi:peptidoglycan/xylan/chitin deacetylase (PgdA/CDA1 family)
MSQILQLKKNNTSANEPKNENTNLVVSNINQNFNDNTNLAVPLQTNYNVPILMYHYIRNFNDPNDKVGTNLSVSLQSFDSQMKYLKDNDYTSINFNDLITKNFPNKSVIITFDDGYNDAFTGAYPILKKYNLFGVFYIITNKIGSDGYVSWNDLKEMSQNKMIIASHSLDHPNMINLEKEKIEKELIESKLALETNLNIKVTDFCYPSGKYSTANIEELKKTGYNSAVTTKSGVSDQNSKLFELPRIRVTNETNLKNILK